MRRGDPPAPPINPGVVGEIGQLILWLVGPVDVELLDDNGGAYLREVDRRIHDWVAGADAASFPALVALAGRPPAWAAPPEIRGWDGEVGRVMGEWARLRPDQVMHLIPDLLHDPRTRPVAADALFWSGNPNVADYMMPFLQEISSYQDDEIYAIIDGLSESPKDRELELLHRLQQLVAPERTGVHDEIEKCIAWAQQRS